MTDCKEPIVSTPSRRGFLSGAATLGVALAAPALFIPAKARSAGRITLVSWGGTYKDNIIKHLIKPFTEETGVEVAVSDTPDLARVKAQVESGNVEWDVFDGVGSQMLTGQANGYWEPIDTSIVTVNDLYTGKYSSTIGWYLFAGSFCWDPKRILPENVPKNFSDLWDATKFPGRRAFRSRISELLEIALVADGVNPDQLYPLDVERGFRSLDRIKPHVRKWTESSPETMTLIQDNEVDFSYTYASRVGTEIAKGASFDFGRGQTVNGLEYLSVLKGSRNKELGMKFIAFCMRPERLAAFCNAHLLAPNTQSAFAMMTDNSKKWVADMKNPQNIILNDEWWQPRFEELQGRFREWLLL